VIYRREAKTNDIQHNKFIVYIKSTDQIASEVWTGSTNLSMGGIHGQTNVGHWVRNKAVAKKYKEYWDILSLDPGAREKDSASLKRSRNAALKEYIELLQPNIEFDSWDDIPQGITPVFSPRSGLSILETYVRMMDNAESMACITLAFGVNKLFKEHLHDNTANPKSKEPFVYIGAGQNTYKAWGAYIKDPLYNWAKEVSTISLGLNRHVAYIHSKFMLIDPLSADPVVVTGSANFSEPSTNSNDENMMIIRGDLRVADIYFTEFNRLFNHYYFRAVYQNAAEHSRADSTNLYLRPDDSWLEKYTPGKFRYKRVDMFSKMEGF